MNFLAFTLCFVSSLIATAKIAHAGNTQGQITLVTANAGISAGNPANLAAVYFDASATYIGTRPSCATKSALFFDPTTTVGGSILRGLIAAKLAGATVTVIGSGACASTGASEDILQVQF